MANNLMYIPNDDKQNYFLNQPTNQNSINVPKVIRPMNKNFGDQFNKQLNVPSLLVINLCKCTFFISAALHSEYSSTYLYTLTPVLTCTLLFQLHSEYRSTYRWYEYTPKQNQVVRRPPQPIAHSGIQLFIDSYFRQFSVENKKKLQN